MKRLGLSRGTVKLLSHQKSWRRAFRKEENMLKRKLRVRVIRAFKRYLPLAGLPQVRFHDLRNTHATLLIAAGVHPKAIQARLGHASINTTLNTYGHLMPSAYEGVGARLDALLSAKIPITAT